MKKNNSAVMQMGHERLPSHVFEWEPEDKLRRGRPRKTWISHVKVAMLNLGLTINDSLNRLLWRRCVFFSLFVGCREPLFVEKYLKKKRRRPLLSTLQHFGILVHGDSFSAYPKHGSRVTSIWDYSEDVAIPPI